MTLGLSFWKKIGIGVLALALMVTVAHYTITYFQITKPTQEKEMVYEVAKTFVLAILKSPATAQFQPFDLSKVAVSTDESMKWYTVSAYVDSQNGFGALMRSDWMIDIEYQGGDKDNPSNWQLKSLIFDGEVVY